MNKYVVLEKHIGETPLECMEKWRGRQADLKDVPLAYAGRLDPMASGALLVLIGDECKQQTAYHNLDKTYHVDILFGVASDSGDVLGIPSATTPSTISLPAVKKVLPSLRSPIELPYPQYSSKTVAGKPLHTWTLEGRLNEITIPTKTSTIHTLSVSCVTELTGAEVYTYVQRKIETIAPVTDARKALGNDFRRPDIRNAWLGWQAEHKDHSFTKATISCTASSGTYMRTLATTIGEALGVPALAYHIHRTELGRYRPLFGGFGIWTTRYRSTPRAF